jgi:hypothetical protein
MARLNDMLGEPEQHYFMQLTGIHPQGVGVQTHRDAIRYLGYVDLHRRKQRTPQGVRPPGLLGMAVLSR